MDAIRVLEALRLALDEGGRRGFPIACGIVDGSGRPLGMIRHEDAIWPAGDLALRKAVLASAFRGRTCERFDRWQAELPLFGTGLAGLSQEHGWFVAPGGSPVLKDDGGRKVCVAAVGISGARPAAIDQEIADRIVLELAG